MSILDGDGGRDVAGVRNAAVRVGCLRTWVFAALAFGAASEAGAQSCQRFVATSGADGTNNCQSSGTPCRTISHAVLQAAPANVVCIAPGVYAEQPVVDKSLTLLGQGTAIAEADAPGYTSITYTGSTIGVDIVQITAPNVTLRNLNIRADASFVRRPIAASSTADGLLVDRVRVVSFQSGGLPPSPAPRRTAIAINFPRDAASTELADVIVRDGYILREPGSAYFQDGIRGELLQSFTARGNVVNASTQAIHAKFPEGNITVAGNRIGGGGVEIGEHNTSTPPHVTAITIENNVFEPVEAAFAGSALRLQQNNPIGAPAVFPATVVRNNRFGTATAQFATGVWLQNYPHVTVEGNTFVPLESAPVAHGLIVSSKVVSSTSDDPSLAPFPFDGIAVLGNRFHGCSAGNCVAVRFAHHRTEGAPAAMFGMLRVGGAGADANAFAGSLGDMLVLDAQAGASTGATVFPFSASYGGSIDATTMVPFGGDVLAPRNLVGVAFDAGGNAVGGTDTTAMTVADLVALNAAQVDDRRDDASPKLRGAVRFGAPQVLHATTGPSSLPNAAGGFAAGDCSGTENATGCFLFDLSNAGSTAVDEHVEVALTIARTGGPGGALAPAAVALEYETAPNVFSPVMLTGSGTLVGALPVPGTPATDAPYALGASSGDVLDRVRVRFAQGGDYTLQSIIRGKQTLFALAPPAVRSIGVVAPGTLAVGDDPANGAGASRTGSTETYDVTLDNSTGGSSEQIDLRITVRGQQPLSPSDLSLVSGGLVTLAAQPDGSLLGRIPLGATAPGATNVAVLSATYASADVYRYTFEAVSASGAPIRSYAPPVDRFVAVGVANGEGGATYFLESTGITGSTPTATDNDYTRIDDVVQVLRSNDVVVLSGRFDWSTGPAFSSWSLGSNGVEDGPSPLAGSIQPTGDFSISVPPGLENITFTAGTALGAGFAGGATIVGGGDGIDPLRIGELHESFLLFWDRDDGLTPGVTTWRGLEISNLHIEGFDVGVMMVTTAPEGSFGTDDFDDLVFRDNTIRVAADVVGSPGEDAFPNEGFMQGWGSGQQTLRNRIELDTSGDPDSGQLGFRIGGNCNVACYDGLLVDRNVVVLTGAGPGFARGIFENAGDTGSDMLFSRNVIDFDLGGATADLGGLTIQSISQTGVTPATVRVRGNTISGANTFGIRVEGTVSPFPNEAGVTIEGNTILGGDNAIRVSDRFGPNPPAPLVRQNRLVGQLGTAIQIQDLNAPPFAATIDATLNWFGCNSGPGQAADPGAGCATATPAVPPLADADPWLVLTAAATPASITTAQTSIISGAFTRDSAGAAVPAPIVFPDGTPVEFAIVPAGDSPIEVPDGTTAGSASGMFDPAGAGLHLASATTDGQVSYVNVLVTALDSVTIVPCNAATSCTPSPADNDYTRVNQALQLVGSNATVVLDGRFDWTEPNAAASWRAGSDGEIEAVCDTPGVDCADDWSIVPAGGRSNVRVRGAGANGTRGGSIVGRGDLASTPYAFESVFYLWPGCFEGWTIENLELSGFESPVQMYNGGGGASCPDAAYRGVVLRHNRFLLPPDIVDEGQQPPTANSFHNIGIHFSFGRDQAIEDNVFVIPGTGSGDSARRPATFAMQSNTSGGSVYDGLSIARNTIRVTNPPAAADSEFVEGIWENAHAHTSDIEVVDNLVVYEPALAPGGTPRPRSHAIEVTSHSSATTTVAYRRNRVIGFDTGIGWLDVPFSVSGLAGAQPVQLVGNDLVTNGVAVRIRASDDTARANLVLNRFHDNGFGVRSEDNAADPAENLVVANDNWWSCNEGPAGPPSDCEVVDPAGDTVVAADWLRLALGAAPAAIAPGASSAITATLDDSSGSTLDFSQYPKLERVVFATSLGAVTPIDDDLANDGSAATALSTDPADQGGALVFADYDEETVTTLVRVGGTTLTIGSCTSEPGCIPTALDNDYTRIDNAVQVLQSGDTLELAGTFDWSTGAAFDSWSRGSDGADDAPGSIEDFSIDVPAGLTNLTIRAAAGGATIRGGGDLASRPAETQESFLLFFDRNDPGDVRSWAGLEIAGLTLEGFDIALYLVTVSPVSGPNDFDDLSIHDNTIRVAADHDPAPAEPGPEDDATNFGIVQGWGSNQRTELNTIEFDASGGPDSGSAGIAIGGNCNNACYDGLVVSANTLSLAVPGPGYIRALFENGADTGSDMSIVDNVIDFGGGPGDFGGIHVESFSNSGPTPATVTVRGNTIRGGNTFGIRVSAVALAPLAGEAGVRVIGNSILGGDRAVYVADRHGRAPPAPALHFNRLIGQSLVISSDFAPLSIDATNNWYGCNAGPGTPASAGCTTGTGTIGSPEIDADPWLVLALQPGSSVVPRSGETSLVANLSRNSAGQDVSGASTFPAAPVAFAIASGGPATLDDVLVTTGTGTPVPRGVAPNALRQLLATTTARATLDGQAVGAEVRVEAVTLDLGVPRAALVGVETTQFVRQVRNDGAPIAEATSASLAISHATTLVPADVELRDSGGNLVTLADSNGDGVLEASFPLGPLAPGELAANYSLRFPNPAKLGNYTFDGLVVGASSGAFYAEDTEVVRVAGPGDVTVVALSGTPQTAPVGQAFTLPLAARVSAFGLPLSNVSVAFAGPASGASIVFDASSNNADTRSTDSTGVATSSTFAASVVAGSFVASASVATCSSPACSASYSLRNTAASPASVSLAAIGCTSATVGTEFCGSGANDLRATVLDANGNPVDGVSVSFVTSIAANGATAVAAPGITALTNGAGVAEVALAANSRAGAYAATAQVAGSPGSLASAPVALTNAADTDPAQIGLVAGGGGGQTAAINSPFGLPLRATVVDRFLNPLGAGYAVTFASPAPGAGANLTQPQPLVSDANGVVLAGISANGTTGSFQVTASLAAATCTTPPANAVTCSTTFGLTNVTTGAASVDLVAMPLQGAVDTGSYALTATVRDAGNNPVPGVSVSFVVDYGANGAGTDANALVVVSNASGIAPATFSANTIAGTFAIRAIVSGAPADSVALENLVGPVDAIVVGSGSGQSAPVGTAFAQPLVVRAIDAFGNPVAGASVAFDAPASGASASFAPQQLVTGSDGRASTTATANAQAGGPYSVTATHVTAGSAAFSLRNLPAAASTITAVLGSTPQSTVVDTAFGTALGVRVVDGSGNPVPGVVVNFIAPTSGATALLSSTSDTTDANGIASVDATAGTVTGSYGIIASASPGTVSFALTNTPDPDRSMAAQPGATPQSAPISTAYGAPLAVRIIDEFGNPVVGSMVTYSVTPAANGASAMLDTTTDATDATGVASVIATANATSGGPFTVQAVSAEGNVTFSLTNLVGGAMQLVKVAGDAQSGIVPGAPVPVSPRVRLLDAGNNPVSGVAVTFTIATGGGTAVGRTVTTNVEGLATVGSWTLGPVANASNSLEASAPGAGTVTFVATSGAASNDVSVTVDNQRTLVRETQSTLYTVTIRNGGTGNASGITLGASFVGLASSTSAWICVASAGATCPAGSGTGTIAGLAFDLPPGGMLTFAVQATVTGLPQTQAGLTVSANMPAGSDPVLGNNSGSDSDPIASIGDQVFGDGFEAPPPG